MRGEVNFPYASEVTGRDRDGQQKSWGSPASQSRSPPWAAPRLSGCQQLRQAAQGPAALDVAPMGLTVPDAETFDTRPEAQPPEIFTGLSQGPLLCPASQTSNRSAAFLETQLLPQLPAKGSLPKPRRGRKVISHLPMPKQHVSPGTPKRPLIGSL